MAGDLSSGDRVVAEAERLRLLLVSTAADLMEAASRLQAEAKLLRSVAAEGEVGGERRPEG